MIVKGFGFSRVMKNEFHNERTKFPHPKNWGGKVWHMT
jgi:hypothetical protein